MSLIALHSFYDTILLNVVTATLKQEGIKSIVHDEHATQTLSIFEARAIGGARLMIHEKDYVKASKILIEMGIINRNDEEDDFAIITTLADIGKSLPIVSNWNKELRFVAVAFLLVAVLFLLIAAAMLFS